MRQTQRTTVVKVTLLFSLLVCVLSLVAAAFASGGASVQGAVYTTVNTAVDGTGHCLNDGGTINCNIYDGKRFVWLNGGPAVNKLRPAGLYFFAAGNPGFQSNPNDASPKNLSCPTVGCLDPYTNRMFTVGSSGEITSYGGTHQQSPGSGGLLLRLCLAACPPYLDTPNPGGEYVMAVCYLGSGDGAHAVQRSFYGHPHGDDDEITYPVSPRSCKYDNFKVRAVDETPPICVLTATITGPPKQIQVMAQDTDSGLASILVTDSTNAVTVVPPFVPGTTAPVVVTSTKLIQTQPSHLALTVTDVAGNETLCDPVVPGVLKRAHRAGTHRLSSRDHVRLLGLRRG